ncbi:GlsB/YeaQ/YmgE family stress response membrane protein [Falsibacillus albus]|uniref:GlsB/YeaQ/YmgE family stress response membrane protein n=1 Tax=Falsibacillus albus TaxID=2478915 RepID=A0A3L7JZ66_9BACI|nr:GlsB/YeaQ/YmgE family stress response membrane protein [Falsibacillus albus]RLQ96178.1 GlsB/YeaQ/YmgE family stress response membrane protein [Falsibacillus albus]
MGLLLYLVIGGIIGWAGSFIAGRNVPGGVAGNIIAGILGAWIGGIIFGDKGPVVAGMAVFPALIGSIIFVMIISLILRLLKNT